MAPKLSALYSLSLLRSLLIGAQIALVTLFLFDACRCEADTQTAAGTIEVPLTIDYTTLGQAMAQQIFTPNGRATLWRGSSDCEYLYAEHPVLSAAGNLVRLETQGHLSIGLQVGNTCVTPIVWNGIVQAASAPYVAGHMLKLRIVDLNLLDAQHQKTLIAGNGFDLVKRYFIPRLQTFEFDLNPATEQLKQLAVAASPPEVAQRVTATLASLQVLPQVMALDPGIRATIRLTLPAMPTPNPAAPTAGALSSQQVAAFETQLDQWDAFLVFAIKQLGTINADPQFRQDLLGLLLDSRARLIGALQNPQSGGPDPVRILFLDQWRHLGAIIRAAAQRGTLGDRSLQFLEFISAGNALMALDQAAPALGMRISAEDLRHLARIMAPQSTADPLAFSFAEDPDLQKMFGINQPLESEGPLDTQPEELPSITPTPSITSTASPVSSATPSASATAIPGESASPSPSPSIAPSPPVTPAISPTASIATPSATATPLPSPAITAGEFSELSWWLIGPAAAYGAEPSGIGGANLMHELQSMAKKLKRAVVDSDNARGYRSDMERLIELSGEYQYADENIDPQYRPLYLKLVKAVAWQESCWRQFVRKNNRVVFLESSSHDVGLMQVNKYVWRGFYSIPRLEWDVLYNSNAGMEILARLLTDLKGKPGAARRGKPDELARSIYAAYNGGPNAYRRWRRHESRETRMIDRSFWQKYQAVLHGQQIDLLSCAAEWGTAAGH
ncbi:MAG: lytic transglycosylase domain-containing protein [Candidatus Binataceae bacterium]|nr:lytic transglycosylase domain-containing protein [Candidatus Binataceae bacterium]